MIQSSCRKTARLLLAAMESYSLIGIKQFCDSDNFNDKNELQPTVIGEDLDEILSWVSVTTPAGRAPSRSR